MQIYSMNNKIASIQNEQYLYKSDADNRPDRTLYYFVLTENSSEIEVSAGPYENVRERDNAAKTIALMMDLQNDGIFWLDVTPTGTPLMGSYGNIEEIKNNKIHNNNENIFCVCHPDDDCSC